MKVPWHFKALPLLAGLGAAASANAQVQPQVCAFANFLLGSRENALVTGLTAGPTLWRPFGPDLSPMT
jgi:hypothetical protein